MSFDHTPLAPLSALPADELDPRPLLTEAAHKALCARLLSFGNILSPEHREALRSVLRGFTRLAFGGRGRIAFPLPTGMGKTQAIVAWCAAAYEAGVLGESGVSVAVATSHIEALCRLKRDLVSAGVPVHLIGLSHSNKHDASEPADLDAAGRPILLATHQRIRGGKVEIFNDYQGQPRSLLIWDESLLVSCARAVKLSDFRSAFGAVKINLPLHGLALAFLAAAEQALGRELVGQLSGRTATPVNLAQDEHDLEVIRMELKACAKASSAAFIKDAVRALLEFVDMTPQPLAVVSTYEANGVITYEVKVPTQLESIAVLDASYPIRELCKMDPEMTQGLDLSHDLKRYDQVTVKLSAKGSGYETVTADARKRDGFYAAMVVQAVQAAGPDASVLVFTFKQRKRRDPDMVQVLRESLQRAGINPDAQVIGPDPSIAPRPRVSFLTWGNEHSLSAYSHCTHVVFAGVLHRSQIDLAASMAGQAGDITLSPAKERVQEVLTSELAHYLYQAMSRGSCREIVNGQAKPMTVWLPMRDELVRPLLDAVAPGLRWESWWPQGVEGSSASFKVAEEITAFLTALPARITKVSAAMVKKSMSVPVTKAVWALAVETVARQSTGWRREDRSWMRHAVAN
jgi:hypothetical protein